MSEKPRPVATPSKKKGKDVDLTPAAPQTGQSRFRFADASLYEGEWKLVPDLSVVPPVNDKNDKNASIIQANKRVRHGQGSFTHPNGTQYSGSWVEDRMEGAGTIVFSPEPHGVCQAKYVGDFSNSQYHGKGRFDWPDGSHYTGDWVNGQLEGQGELVVCNGSSELHRFVGTFHADQFVNETGQWIAPHVPLHYV